jgi:hypothetical protein
MHCLEEVHQGHLCPAQERPVVVALSQAGGRQHCRACLAALLPPKLLEDPRKRIRCASCHSGSMHAP